MSKFFQEPSEDIQENSEKTKELEPVDAFSQIFLGFYAFRVAWMSTLYYVLEF